MEFRILGPLEVSTADGPLPLGGRKQRLVLAHLIVRANDVVPIDVLIDEVWGDEPPDSVRSTLQGYVSHLRRALGAERLEGGGSGYLLHVGEGELDATTFEGLFREARASLSSDPIGAAIKLAEALDLWRGPTLADLADEISLRGEIARLEELRLAATEHRISAELAIGRHTTVISELEALTARHPLRERLWAHLMLAMYRGGRQAEALGVYERARGVLASELGTDPSPELQRLHGRILAQDPELARKEPPRPSIRPSRADLAPGTEFAGYRIQRILGRGGMSVVYLAEHAGLQRRVALKVLAPQLAEDERFRERFVRESRLAASLDHPNVIPIYEAGESEGELFIAMRYVEGTDLRSLLNEGGPLQPSRAAAIVHQVAAALDAAHEQGLVHRDVKPANVLLARPRGSDAGQHVYLSDFGLTKRAASDSGITGTGQFVGTLDYAAPEQFKGGTADARTDVYSLGCVLFEALTGHPPFRADNDGALMYAHLQEDAPAASAERRELPPSIDPVIEKAMAKAPADRHRSAGELAREASRVLGGEPEAPTREGRRPTRARLIRLVPLIGTILALLIVTVVVARRPDDGSAGAGAPTGVAEAPETELVDPARAVAAVDPNDGTFVESVGGLYVNTLGATIRPDVAFADGRAWVVAANSVTELDPEAVSVEAGPSLSSSHPRFRRVVVTGSGYVLAIDGFEGGPSNPLDSGILRIDLTTGESDRARFTGAGPGSDLEVGAGAVWMTFSSGELLRIDQRSLRIDRSFVLGGTYDVLGVDDRWVWVGDGNAATVRRLDPRDGGRSEPIPMEGAVDEIAVWRGVAWVLDRDAGAVTPVDTTFGPGQPIQLGPDATDIEAGLHAIWVSDRDGSLWRVDPQTRETSTIDVGYPIEAVTVDQERGVVWVLLVECSLGIGLPSEGFNVFGCPCAYGGCPPRLSGMAARGSGA